MNKITLTLNATTLMIALSLGSAEANQNSWCAGKVLGAYITSNGDVVIKPDWRNDWIRICNTGNDPINCSLWASIAINAFQDNLDVQVMYRHATKIDCQAIPTYSSAPLPYYFMMGRTI